MHARKSSISKRQQPKLAQSKLIEANKLAKTQASLALKALPLAQRKVIAAAKKAENERAKAEKAIVDQEKQALKAEQDQEKQRKLKEDLSHAYNVFTTRKLTVPAGIITMFSQQAEPMEIDTNEEEEKSEMTDD